MLSEERLQALREALAARRDVARALVSTGDERPVLVLEYDERPPSARDAGERLRGLVAALEAALGEAAAQLGFAAGGPEEVARVAARADVIYLRASGA